MPNSLYPIHKGIADKRLTEADYCFCGPESLMVNIYQDFLARHIQVSRVHSESSRHRRDCVKRTTS